MRQRIETALAINEASPQSILQKLADDPKGFGRTLKAIVKNPSVKYDLKKRTINRISRCGYEIIDYPFTKCVPKSADRQSIEQSVGTRTTRSGSSCYYDYNAERYKDAMESCQHEANQGKAHAQYNLAHLYRTSNGGVQNKAKAVKYYQLAADQNYGGAQFSLGIMYFQGSGIGKDMEKARYWWERSAQNGISISRVKKALNKIPR